jgi:hypothetical protein
LAWALLSAAGALWGRYVVDPLIPVLTVVTTAINTAYLPILEYRGSPGGDKLTMTAHVSQPIYVHSSLTLNPGSTMADSVDGLHVLVPIVILFAALFAWPVDSWRERTVLVALGVPAAIVISAVTVPFLLSGELDAMLIDYAAGAGLVRRAGPTVYWMVFCESGGRWLIPLVAAIFCALSVRPLLDLATRLRVKLRAFGRAINFSDSP